LCSVTVVIPYHNGEQYIGRSVRSVLDQTYPVYEIIIIDDASSKPLLSSDIPMDDRINILRLHENVGGAGARNIGLKAAKGEYVALLDCDDEWLPHKLERQIASMSPGRSRGTLYLCGTIIMENGKVVSQSKSVEKISSPLEAVLVGGAFLQTSTYLLCTSEAIRVGFDPNLRKHQDWDFLHRWYLAGNGFHYIDEALSIYHRGGSSQVSRSRKADHSLKWIMSVQNELTDKAAAKFFLSEIYPIEFGHHPLAAMRTLLRHVVVKDITWPEAVRMTRYAFRLSVQSRFARS